MKRYSSQEDIMAVILGKLVHDFGQINLGRVNKLLAEVGFDDKINTEELRDWAEFIQGDEELQELNEQAVNGDVDLDSIIVEVIDEEGEIVEESPLEDTNIDKVLSPAIKEHERVLSQNREFRRIQKDGSYLKILMEDLKEELLDELPTLSEYKPKVEKIKTPRSTRKSGLIMQNSDWHIGAVIPSDVDYAYGYNWDIFKERLKVYETETLKMVENFNPGETLVLHNGDIVEQIFMRNVNQAFETEFNLSQQISLATRTIYELLENISQHTDVTFGLVGGNHDRLQANKKDDVFNQSSAYIVLDMLILMQESGKLQDVNIIDNRDNVGTLEHNLAGKNVHVVHGDYIPKKSNNPIANLIRDENIDLLLTGHYHNFSIQEESYGRMNVVSSSIMGANNYSEQHNFGMTKPSQNLIYLDENLNGPVIYPVYFE